MRFPGRTRRVGTSTGLVRRSGPSGEERWWDPHDQVLAERPMVQAADLGRGWRPASMVNNVERLDPLGDDEASASVRDARDQRRLTALDEGRAWRHRDLAALVVVRTELFADDDPDGTHRDAWRRFGPSSLESTWRQRWVERDREPGWIEARPVESADRPAPLHRFDREPASAGASGAVDWMRIEDHTDPTGRRAVTLYEHLTVWRSRHHVVLTIRHDLALDLDEVAANAAAAVYQRIGS